MFIDPEAPGPVSVSGDVNIVVSSAAPAVQFYLDDVEYGPKVAVDAGTASAQWPTWSQPNGDHTWTAADCDTIDPGSDCNPEPSSPLVLTIANAPPTIAAPTDGADVAGDVTVTATTAAPLVQFSLDSVAFGAPVAGNGVSASVQWPTWSLPDGAHSWTAADCDDNGCNEVGSTPVGVTIDNTPPTFSTPTNGASVAGNVPVTVATAAPSVQFALGGVAFGSPVTASGGSASTQWPTFGLANGSYEWTAAACDDLGCNAELSTIDVTLSNAAPAITSPVNGDVAPSTIAIQATSPGGGIAFFVDGVQVAFDAAAPYSFTPSTPLSLGSHTASVKQCDTTGAVCNGPSSPTTTFTVGKLSPSITSVTPTPFSPGTSSTRSRTSFRVHLPEAQRLTFLVRNDRGQTVDGPHSQGLESTGNHTYQWDGRNNVGKVVRDGTYTIVVDTATGTGATLLEGAARATVRVDHTGTSFHAVTGAKATVYPVRDGYRDKFRPTVRVDEGGRLRMVIFAPNGSRVRGFSKSHARPGTFQFGWNGRNAKNQLVSTGKYHFRFLAEDRAGNLSVSKRYLVRISHRRTVRKSIRIVRPGDVGRVGTTNARCTQYSFGFSKFAHGMWLDNFCDRGFDDAVIYADYSLVVPGAVQYDGIRVRTAGATYSPGPISVQVYNFTDSKWEAAGRTTLRTKSRVINSKFRRVSGVHRVSLRHRVRIRVVVPNHRRQEDYDIALAGAEITYRVLK